LIYFFSFIVIKKSHKDYVIKIRLKLLVVIIFNHRHKRTKNKKYSIRKNEKNQHDGCYVSKHIEYNG